MKIRLGYACVPVTIDETSSHSLTYTNYKKLGDKGNIKLDSVIKSNFESLEKILKYNIRNDITFFRMTSELIPLANHPDVDYDFIDQYKIYYKKIGDIINENNLRVDLHPSAYTVLNSVNDSVVTSTINILEFYQKMYKSMDIKSKIVLHVGSKVGGKRLGIKRFIDNFNKLSKEVQELIVVENDDKSYNIRNVLSLCEKINIPMVLDYHHYKLNKNNEKIEDYIERIFNTWKNEIPKIHFSSPKDKKNKRSHNDYINVDDFIEFLEKIKFTKKDFDVMIEAKKKDDALFRLIRELKYKTDYKIDKNTIFL
ncbi:MAG: UV DNA damage repair endonuclease UvsE [Firmicutes bacterium]|nr:UV DNA damage repair endonuclease UvsE [Bacillota bacterium]